MDRILYTAMAGAKQSFDRQATISNNLANVSTTGFREQLNERRSVPVPGDARLDTRHSVVESTPLNDFSTGPIEHTGRPLDVAMKGDAWLSVLDANGEEAYTRRGDLTVNGDGVLMTGSGQFVLGDGGPVLVPPGSEAIISDDAGINVRTGNGDLVRIGSLKLVEPGEDGLVRGGDGLFRPTESLTGELATLEAGENLGVIAGALEGSNVNPVEGMVAMIEAQRMYETHMKTIEKANENARSANSLLSIRG